MDYDIKEAYEATFDPNKAVYKDMIEEGMLKRIEEINPIEACKLRIDRYKKLLRDEETKLYELEEFERKNKRNKQQAETQKQELDHFRITKFHDKKDVLLTQYNNGVLDFTKNAGIFKFKNASEFQEWITPLLTEA